MTAIMVYDNSLSVPQDITNLLGVNKFSEIYYRKRSLDKWVHDICKEAGIKFVEISGDVQSDAAKIRQLGFINTQKLVVMYMPSNIAFGCDEVDASPFLKKLSFSRSPVAISGKELISGDQDIYLSAVVGQKAKELLQAIESNSQPGEFISNEIESFKLLHSDVELIDMCDPLRFTDYLTSNFDVRFFNSVQPVDNFTLIKYSSDAKKLERECKYYDLLPPELKMFFIQTYDLKLEAKGASYKMERLFVPDMSLQWIHGSMNELNFERFLDKVLHFIKLRPVKKVDTQAAQKIHSDAYIDKVKERLAQLKSLPEYQTLEPFINSRFGNIDRLFERYYVLFEKHGRNKSSNELRIGHGDLCFSNILYSKTTGLMRFIDPRGALKEDDLFVSPYYDLAKLSHSVCGNYDFINHGLCSLELEKDLKVKLVLNNQSPSWAKTIFFKKLQEIGYDPYLIRLFESSLFLSMVPLHIDSPKKVIAFLINAENIMNEIENAL